MVLPILSRVIIHKFTLHFISVSRFRQLAKNAREAVSVYASGIHGRGLFCKREISAGEMVIEYAGQQIRSILTDYRERYYDRRGIGCYMFRLDDDVVVDATMSGNAARFINHSCEVSPKDLFRVASKSLHAIFFEWLLCCPTNRSSNIT